MPELLLAEADYQSDALRVSRMSLTLDEELALVRGLLRGNEKRARHEAKESGEFEHGYIKECMGLWSAEYRGVEKKRKYDQELLVGGRGQRGRWEKVEAGTDPRFS
jgi:hypothetical protein